MLETILFTFGGLTFLGLLSAFVTHDDNIEADRIRRDRFYKELF